MRTARGVPQVRPPSSPGADGNAIKGDVERALRDLQAALHAAGEQTEETLAAHPVVSVAAAFLLGVAVGRAMSGSRL
jgi:hypothetical protein